MNVHYILLLLFIFCQLVDSNKRKHHSEWHRHPSCHYCSNNSSDIIYNYNETIETNKFIVDIFILLKYNSEYKYIVDETYWYLTKIIESLNDPFFFNRIHMITDSIDVYNKGKSSGYYMYNMSDFTTLEYGFYNVYANKHNSYNKLDYEFLCFYRWILYKQIITHWNNNITDINLQIHRVLSIDSDILFYMNPSKFYYDVINSLYYNDHIVNYNTLNNETQYEYELIVTTKGAVQLFTSNGLITYANYIFSFYNRPVYVVNSVTSAAAVSYFNHKVFSDMQLIELFCNENKYKRNICYEDLSTSTGYTRTTEQNCLIERLGCIPLGNINIVMKMKKYSLYYKNKNFFGVNDTVPYCYVHFQGDAAKEYFNVYARYQTRVLNLTLDNHALLIQTATQASIYYIDSNGYRRPFESYYQFLSFNFSDWMIINNLPYFVVEGFPLGKQLTYLDDNLVANNL